MQHFGDECMVIHRMLDSDKMRNGLGNTLQGAHLDLECRAARYVIHHQRHCAASAQINEILGHATLWSADVIRRHHQQGIGTGTCSKFGQLDGLGV